VTAVFVLGIGSMGRGGASPLEARAGGRGHERGPVLAGDGRADPAPERDGRIPLLAGGQRRRGYMGFVLVAVFLF